MKTRLPLLIGFGMLSVLSVRAQQIANGGFEDWSNVLVNEELDAWRTGNGQYPGLVTTTKVPDMNGGWAAHLQTHILPSDTAFGFILHGDFQQDIPTGGVAFTTSVDAIEGWYRYHLQPGDSAGILVGVWVGGVLASFDLHKVGGMQMAWTAFSLPVNGGVPITPDSVVVGAASSNPFGPDFAVDGSWIELDGIQLTAAGVTSPDVLPNNEMEDWYDLETLEADDWNSFNGFLASHGAVSVTQGIPNSGVYSARIATVQVEDGVAPGLLTNGTLTAESVSGGVPYSEVPATLDGYVAYEPAGADTARIYALFTSNGGPVGSAFMEFSELTTGWLMFSAPVIMLLPPDTMLLVITAGQNPGSVLWVDDLAFTGLSTGITETSANGTRLYPNPATDEVNIVAGRGWDGRWTVVDATGRVVLQGSRMWSGTTARIDVAPLVAGRYMVVVSTGTGVERMPFVKR